MDSGPSFRSAYAESGLVFTVAPQTATVTFELRVDGRAQPEHVRLGGEGTQAAMMPLRLDGAAGLDGSAGAHAKGALFQPPPESPGRGPGYRLWRTRPAAAEQQVVLDDETRERLRSLGYID